MGKEAYETPKEKAQKDESQIQVNVVVVVDQDDKFVRLIRDTL